MSDFLTRINHFSPKRLALLADELNTRVQQLERERHEAIAIVGIGCRLPGHADTPEAFWQLIRDGVDAITEVPPDRWDIDALYDPDPDVPGKMASRWGGFLSQVDGFDPDFFGISPREAKSMDPQQRLLLEVTWEALENAAIPANRVAGTRTGVFIGMSAADYLHLLRGAGPGAYDAYTASGVAHSIASGRLSYVLGARGPSLSIDTACSSSLVAIHEAVHSLRRGESDMALAGGVNLILGPDITIALSRSHMMAPDGRCKVFDARADGFVRSEGCGMLVLKRLSDAEADGDRIVALIRGSAANQDGRSNGLTAPNGPSQEGVLRDALADAQIDAAAVDFVEAHGTGTSLGDPIEIQALAEVLGRARSHDDPLLVGSVKANVGHLEAAAGVTAVIKLALALQNGEVPGQPQLQRLNPFIPWDRIAVRVPTCLTRWPARPQGRRIGGVSSFGFSGTNVHLVLAAAPQREAARPDVERPLHLILASAKQESALGSVVQGLRDRLNEGAEALGDVAFTANAGRSHFVHRTAVIAASASEAVERMDAYLQGRSTDGVFAGSAGVRAPRVAFLFTGQGAQYAGMAAELYASQPVFRATVDRCDALLSDRLSQPLLTVLFPPDGVQSPIGETEFTQPALFAIEYALANLWMAWGVRPAAVMGHSVGEVVAACVAGVLSLEDGLMLIAERGRLMGALPRDGKMAAVMADEARVRAAIAPFERDVSIAAINGPDNIVISGLAQAVDEILSQLRAQTIECTPLKVSHAFHSPLIEPMLDGFERFVGTLRHHEPVFDVISNVTGQPLGARAIDAQYWRVHARAAVQFAPAIKVLIERGCTACIEIGPHPTLLGMARQCPGTETMLALPSLRRGRSDWAQMLESLAALYTAGADIDWAAFDAPYGRRKVVLPTYPFQRERYWVDAAPMLAPQDPPPVREMVYELVWRPVPSGDQSLPAPLRVAAQVRPAVSGFVARFGLDRYAEFVPELDRLASASIVRAFRQLGLVFTPGEVLDTGTLAARSGVLPAHRRLFERMFAILAEDGVLSAVETSGTGQRWRVLAAPIETDPEALADTLMARFPDCHAELKLTRRCARDLQAVLRGEADPLALLFPGGSLADAERLYRDSPPAKMYNGLVAEVFGALAGVSTRDHPLRILEIGAGTGSTTSHVLSRLPEHVEYTFTDVSQLFLNRAREKFADRAFMRYALLDVSRAPAPQGFVAGTFDVIVAANVLHATPDLATTIAHVYELLAPGGLLVLLEGTTPQRFGDLTVGLLDGWWAYRDTDRRNYALMDGSRWLDLLAQHGFENALAIPGDTSHPVLKQQEVFVAQRPAAACAMASPSRWLIVPDDAGYADALSAALRAAGDMVEIVPADAGVTGSALRQALGRSATCNGVINLQPLGLQLNDSIATSTMWADQERAIRTALEMVHALSADANTAGPSLWLVTRGAQPALPNESANPAQATVWGLSHVIAIEHPELGCRRIDLDPTSDLPTAVTTLIAELRSTSREDQIAVRGAHRLARRLVRHVANAERALLAPSRILPDRTYLVTGGLRGLGLRVAQWLVEQGARHLMLMGRASPMPPAERAIADLRSRNVQIALAAGDVSVEADVQRVLDHIRDAMPPLAGVIHAAGALDDGVLAAQRWERFATVMAAKVRGSWNLHRLAGDLDFLVLFSSGASVAGSAGQGNHAAANAFEDALSWYRQSRGLATVSINWGPWAEIGAAADRKISGPGFLQLIAPDDGLRALAYAMRRDGVTRLFGSAQLAVLASDWSRLATGPEKVSPLFGELVSDVPPALGPSPAVAVRGAASPSESTSRAPVTTPPNRLGDLATAGPDDQASILSAFLTEQVAAVLGLKPGHTVDQNRSLMEMGLDSLMALELRNRIQTTLNARLSMAALLKGPSIHALSGEVLAVLPTMVSTPSPVAADDAWEEGSL